MSRSEAASRSIRAAAILFGFAMVGTLMLAGSFVGTEDRIRAAEARAKLELIKQVLPGELFDNDLMADHVTIKAADAPELGNLDDTLAYRASRQGAPSGLVLEAIAPDGYAGRIKLIVGLLADGRVSGVRVISHKETPGLGDYIQIGKEYLDRGVGKADWIRVFDGKAPGSEPWRVRKDGGDVAYMAGATITPRAVVKAVYKAQKFYLAHRDQLMKQESGK